MQDVRDVAEDFIEVVGDECTHFDESFDYLWCVEQDCNDCFNAAVDAFGGFDNEVNESAEDTVQDKRP